MRQPVRWEYPVRGVPVVCGRANRAVGRPIGPPNNPGAKPDPVPQPVVCFRLSTLSTGPLVVQQTGRLNVVFCVRRDKARIFSGCKSRPATQSLQPVAIGAAVEVTKPQEPSMQRVALATPRAGRP